MGVLSLLIELLEMFLGAFNYFFSSSDSNYIYFSEVLSVFVLVTVLVTCCLAFLIVLFKLFDISFKGRR